MDAGLEEDAYLAALREGEVAGSVPLQRRADAFRKLLLRLDDYVAVTLIDVLPAVADSFLFYVAHGNNNSYKFHKCIFDFWLIICLQFQRALKFRCKSTTFFGRLLVMYYQKLREGVFLAGGDACVPGQARWFLKFRCKGTTFFCRLLGKYAQ